MALRAGYHGLKRALVDKLFKMPSIEEIGNGLTLDDGVLTGDAGSVVANPEGSATGTLEKLQVGETVYTVPGNDNSKCYQTDDTTESAIVDSDYIPFFDSSAASGAGAPRKSTWSNFCSKIAAKINAVTDGLNGIEIAEGVGATLSGDCYLKKIGNIVYANIVLNGVTAAAYSDILTLPEGFRPISDVYLGIKKAGADNLFMAKIYPAGNMQSLTAFDNKNLATMTTSWLV